ncbi:zinc ribbon domain-containing protein [Alistipes communis]|uniref:zinc ribbon domain-containing protein n=1 Tax=Alistipes communis TaxID=2585118 RepID=UPI003AEFD7E5
MIFCQSCGMPMKAPEHFGAEADGSPSSETIKKRARHSKSARGITPCRVPRSSPTNPRSRRTTRTAAGRF